MLMKLTSLKRVKPKGVKRESLKTTSGNSVKVRGERDGLGIKISPQKLEQKTKKQFSFHLIAFAAWKTY